MFRATSADFFEAMWLKGSEALHLENKSLKKKLEAAERENRELKQSLYELTAKHGAAMLQLGRMEASEVATAVDMAESGAQIAQHEAEIAQLAHQQREAEVKNRIEPPRTTGEEPQDSATALQFYYKYDLRGHTGAVYTVRFSPNGRLLASGSFDQTVRCWDIEKPLQQEETLCLQVTGHSPLHHLLQHTTTTNTHHHHLLLLLHHHHLHHPLLLLLLHHLLRSACRSTATT